ncbi:hypothetical protein ABK040_012097 [Willaertia magna]
MSLIDLYEDCLYLIFQYLPNNTIVNLRLINNSFNELITTKFSHHWNKVIEPILTNNTDILTYYKIEFHKPKKHYLLTSTLNFEEFKTTHLPFIIYLDSKKLITFKKSFYLIYADYTLRESNHYGYESHQYLIETQNCFVKKKRALLRKWKFKKEFENRDCWNRWQDFNVKEVVYAEYKTMEIPFNSLTEIPKKGVKKAKEIKIKKVGDLTKDVFNYHIITSKIRY